MPKNILTKNQLSALAKKYKLAAIYLFGSRARGDITATSDYDFAIIFKDSVKKEDYSRLQVLVISELLIALKTEKVDLIILNSEDSPLLLKYNIIQEGKLLFESDKEHRVWLETDILIRFWDWEYFEKLCSQSIGTRVIPKKKSIRF